MPQSLQTHIVALMCTAKNFKVNPKIDQAKVDFVQLHKALTTILWSDNYDVTIQIPNFYLDLKATSDLMRSGPTGLHDHLTQMNKRLHEEELLNNPVFKAETTNALNGTLNCNHHCPALFPLAITATPDNFLKWSNERLSDGLGIGKNHNNVASGKMPKSSTEHLANAFDNKVAFEQAFMYTPLDGQSYQKMILEQIKAELPKNKRAKFDRELIRIGEKLANQS